MLGAALLAVLVLVDRFAAGEVGREIETRYGEPLLFRLRQRVDPPEVPSDIVLVTPRRTWGLGDSALLRDWDRTRHATALAALSSLGAEVVVYDVYFRERNEWDEAFARAIDDSRGTVLVQLASEITLTGGEDRQLVKDILRNPVSSLARSADRLAPSLVSAGSERTERILLFHEFLHDAARHRCFGYPPDSELPGRRLSRLGEEIAPAVVPTLPLAALEQRLVADGELQRAMRHTSNPELAALASRPLDCVALRQVRQAFARLDPEDERGGDDETEAARRMRVWWRAVRRMPGVASGEDVERELRLNFYGPPGSFRTFDYLQVEACAARLSALDTTDSARRDGTETCPLAGSAEVEPNPFRGATVFVGGAFDTAAERKADGFVTALSSPDRPLPGVEVAATAYANLLSDNAPTPYSSRSAAVAVWGSAGLTFSLAAVFRTRQFLALLTSAIALAPLLAALAFGRTHQLPPLIIPSATAAALGCAVVAYRLLQSDRAMAFLEPFLPAIVARQLLSGDGHVVREGVCMVTDIRGFTAIAAALPPADVHRLSERYFSLLFDCASRHGADVVKTYGDSMTAVWTAESADRCAAAVRAGLDILERVEAFGADRPETPFHTRIGIAAGTIAVGHVGVAGRRTVELSGSTVYVAARLEQLNERLGTSLLVTRALADEVGNLRTRAHGRVELKGFDSGIEVVEIIGALDRA